MSRKMFRVIAAGTCSVLYCLIPLTGQLPRGLAEPVTGQPGVDRDGDPLPTGAVVRLGTSRLRRAEHVAFSPDGKTIATCRDKTINIWDVRTGKELRRFEAEGDSSGLAFSPEGSKLAHSRLGGLSVDVFDLNSGKAEQHLKAQKKGLYYDSHSLVFSLEGKKLYSVDDKNGYVWDVKTGRVVLTIRHAPDEDAWAYAVAFSADGSRLAVIHAGMRVSRMSAQVWDTATEKPLHTFQPKDSFYSSLTFTPDAARLVLGHENGTVEFRDMATGKIVHSLPAQGDMVGALSVSPDGTMLAMALNKAIGSGDREKSAQQIVLWDLKTDKPLRTVPAPNVQRVVFGPDNRTLAWVSCQESVCLLEAATGQDLHGFEAHTGGINQVAYLPDGKLIATASADNDVRLWKPDTGECVRTLRWHRDGIGAMAISSDGRLLASGASDRTLAVWDMATGRRLWSVDDTGNDVGGGARQVGAGVRSIAFSPDNKTMAVAVGVIRREVVVYDADTGRIVRNLKLKGLFPDTLVFSRDGKFLIVGEEGVIQVLDLKTEVIVRKFSTNNRKMSSMALSPDGKVLAAGCDKTHFLWNIESGEEIATKPGFLEHCGGRISFSPDGRYFASVNYPHWTSVNSALRIWDLKTGNEVILVALPPDWYQCLAFSPDGKSLVTGSRHAEALVWPLKGP